jgi:Sigma-70 factor, region 1.2
VASLRRSCQGLSHAQPHTVISLPGSSPEVVRATPAKVEKFEPAERTDDPVRMYFREMGSVELLSRAGKSSVLLAGVTHWILLSTARDQRRIGPMWSLAIGAAPSTLKF